MGSHSLLQGVFLSPGLNPALLYCRRILFHPSHEGSPKIRLGFCHNNVRKNKQRGGRVSLGTGTEASSSQAGGTSWDGPRRGTQSCNQGRKLRAWPHVRAAF